jgi:small-conductance mechanosensitive channel
VLFYVIVRIRRRLLRRIPLRAERALQKRRVTLFGQDLTIAAVKSLRVLLDGIAWVAVAMVAYSWLTYSLTSFPLTEPWGDGLAGFLVDTGQMIGLGILNGIPELIIVFLVMVVTRFFARLVAGFFDAVERGQVSVRGVHPDTADATRRIATALVWIFGVAIAYPFIPGSQSDAFKGISVLVGLMVSLGSSGVINQAMSGMVVVFSRALKAGEYVCVGEYEGIVTEVGALSTKLRTPRREEINIPNALLVSSTTKNYSRLADKDGVIVFATAGIGYDAPWRTVHQLLIDAALRTPGLKREPSPFVRQGALSSFCVDYTINAYLEQPEKRFETLSNLHANIQDAFNEASIQIMTPAFESQPQEPVLVPKSKWNAGGAAPGDPQTR